MFPLTISPSSTTFSPLTMKIPLGMSPNFFPTWMRSTVWWKTKLAEEAEQGQVRGVQCSSVCKLTSSRIWTSLEKRDVQLELVFWGGSRWKELPYRIDQCSWGNRSGSCHPGAAPGASLREKNGFNCRITQLQVKAVCVPTHDATSLMDSPPRPSPSSASGPCPTYCRYRPWGSLFPGRSSCWSCC